MILCRMIAVALLSVGFTFFNPIAYTRIDDAKAPAASSTKNGVGKIPAEDSTSTLTKKSALKSTPVNPLRVLPVGQLSKDERLTKNRKLDDKYHPWDPPTSLAEVEKWRREVRTQLLVSLGLWPMPAKTPMQPVITGKIERDDYVIENVYFQSIPGHYVTGNIYRPKNAKGKIPGVLCPHGHWANGRFYDAGEQATISAMLQKGEQFVPNSRFPLQARMATLARMGCVVFHYDMVGYADSTVIDHRDFKGANAILQLQSVMGLQTWNSIRSLDYLMQRSDVDNSRIGITGASGGGTQSFILCAIDDRPTVAFPAVMVSTDMQGGCVCENCALLRIGRNNVEFAAMFAPKPQAMSGADDWTINIESKGLPELKRLYALLGAPENVAAKCFPQFKHNYNQVSREMMYVWFNRHLKLGLNETFERPIDPVSPSELSVFNASHPLPKDAKSPGELQRWWTQRSAKMMQDLEPKDAAGLARYKEVVGTAIREMVHDHFPAADQVKFTKVGSQSFAGFTVDRMILQRATKYSTEPKPAVPAVILKPDNANGRILVWLTDSGHSSLWDSTRNEPNNSVKKGLANGFTIVSPDVLLTGENQLAAKTNKAIEVDKKYAGYTYCYNRTLFAERISDAITCIAFARNQAKDASIDLMGRGEASLWALVTKAICGSQIRRTALEWDGRPFQSRVQDPAAAIMLPGVAKYGDAPALIALCAPDELLITSADPSFAEKISSGWKAARMSRNFSVTNDAGKDATKLMDWILKD